MGAETFFASFTSAQLHERVNLYVLYVKSILGQRGDCRQSVARIFAMTILGEQRLMLFPVAHQSQRGVWQRENLPCGFLG